MLIVKTNLLQVAVKFVKSNKDNFEFEFLAFAPPNNCKAEQSLPPNNNSLCIIVYMGNASCIVHSIHDCQLCVMFDKH